MTNRLAAVVVLAVAGLLASVGTADAAPRKRVVVLDFEGPKADKFHDDLVKLVKKSYTVVPTDKWNGTADEMGATKPTDANVAKIAKKLKVDGVITGTIDKRRDEYLVHVKLRDGKTGAVSASSDTKSSGPRLDGKSSGDIKDELLAAIDQLGTGGGKGGGDDDDDDAKAPPKKATPAKKGDDDDDDDAKAPKKKPIAAKKGDDDDDDDAKAPKKKPAPAAKKGDDDDDDGGKTVTKKSGFGKKKPAGKGGDDDDDDDAKTAPPPKKVADDAKKPAPKKSGGDDDDNDAKAKPAAKVDAKADGDDDDDSKPTPKKPPKKVAKGGDDDGDGDDSGSVHKGTGDDDDVPLAQSGDLALGQRAVDADIGLSVTARKMTFKYHKSLTNAPPGYNGVPVAGGYIDGVIYPGAIGHKRAGIVKDLGLVLAYERVLHVTSQVRFTDDEGAAQVASLPSHSEHWAVGAAVRHAFNDSPTSPVIEAEVRYNHQSFLVQQTIAAQMPGGTAPDIPNVTYKGVEPRVKFSDPLSAKLELFVDAGVQVITSAGEIGLASEYGSGSMLGFDAELGGNYLIKKNIFVRASARLETIGLTFKGTGTMSTSRDGDPTTQDVQGARDTYYGGTITLGFLY